MNNPSIQDKDGPDPSEDVRTREIVKEILLAINSIRYGAVEVTIHDSRVVQIERKEKVRFNKAGSKE